MKSKILILIMILFSFVGYAQWDDCPYGEIDEEFPGTCGKYIDTNSDDLCDHSQTNPTINSVSSDTSNQEQIAKEVHYDFITGKELKTKTVEEVADLYSINAHQYAAALKEKYPGVNIHCSTNFQELHDNYGLEPSVAKEVAGSLKSLNEPQVIKEDNNEKRISITKTKKPYIMIPIFIISTLLYLTTYILTKKKIMKLRSHIKLWNYLLLISFIVSGGLGVMLVFKINFGWFLNFPINMMYWHVEFGVVMAILTIFHIIWYMPYFRRIKKY